MDAERLLLSKVAATGRVNEVLTRGFQKDHFSDGDNAEVWQWMVSHTKQYRTAPSFGAVRSQFPEHNFELAQDSLEYLMDEFAKAVKRRFVVESLREVSALTDDPENDEKIDEIFLQHARDLASSMPSSAVVSRFGQGMFDRIDRYERGENMGRVARFGIPGIDDLTGGIMPAEYITIAGFTGKGKSTLTQHIICQTWLEGKNALFISLEMNCKQLEARWDTMLVNFEHKALQRGALTEEEVGKWREEAEKAKLRENEIWTMDDIRGCTPERVYSEIMRYSPDLVALDYVTLMTTSMKQDANWEMVTQITRELKEIARVTKVPIIGVAQTNRSGKAMGVQMDNIAYSQSIVQDSDILLGLEQTDEQQEMNQMSIVMRKNRDGRTGTTDMFWDPSHMEFKPWVEGLFKRDRNTEEEVVTV